MDVLSLMYRYNKLFHDACNSQFSPIYYEEMQAISSLTKKEVIKYWGHFREVYDYLNFDDIDERINELIALLVLVILRFRIYYIKVRIFGDFKPLDRKSDNEIERMKLLQEAAEKREPRFYFSEVVVYQFSEQITVLTNLSRF